MTPVHPGQQAGGFRSYFSLSRHMEERRPQPLLYQRARLQGGTYMTRIALSSVHIICSP